MLMMLIKNLQVGSSFLTKPLLVALLMLASLGLTGQTVNINSLTAKGQGVKGNCFDTTTRIDFTVIGKVNNPNQGQMTVKADFGDGMGFDTVDNPFISPRDSNRFFSSFKNTFNSAGQYNVEVVVSDTSGTPDTSTIQVTIDADNCPTIKGSVYEDANGDCTLGSSELKLSKKVRLLDNNNQPLDSVDGNKDSFAFQVTSGQTYKLQVKDTGFYTNSCQPTSGKIVTNVPANNANLGMAETGQGSINFTSISSRFNVTGNCAGPGDRVTISTKATGTNRGQKADIYANFDNGLGFQKQYTATVSSDSFGLGISPFLSKRYSQSGTYKVQVVADLRGGPSDTTSTTIDINGNCDTISGTLYLDLDSNCLYSQGDFAYPRRARIALLDGNNNRIARDQVREEDKTYAFAVKPSGSYQIRFTDTGNYRHSCHPGGKQQVSQVPARNVDFGLQGNQGNLIKDFFIDSASITNCIKPGDVVPFRVDGRSRFDYRVNFGAGSGYGSQEFVRRDSSGKLFDTFSKRFNQPGSYTVTIAATSFGVIDFAKIPVVVSNNCKTIKGTIYVDSTNNCSYDAKDPGIEGRTVKLLNAQGKLIGTDQTDQNGAYELGALSGQSYTVSFKDTGTYTHTCQPSGTKQVSNPSVSGVNFGLNCVSSNDFRVASANLEQGEFRVGRERILNFSLAGSPFCSDDSLRALKVVLDQNQVVKKRFYSSTTNGPKFSSKNNKVIKWDLTNLSIKDFNKTELPIKTRFNTNLGDTACVKIILETDDINQKNDTAQICREIVGSYDPNNKVAETGTITSSGFFKKGQAVNYTINFQNTGNAPAFYVRVEDTLSQKLDPATLNVLGTSHPYSLNIERDSILKFQFRNIVLPDSNANEPESHGFVQFTIQPYDTVAKGTSIDNSAAIYFDQNPPIFTNTVTNTICDPVRKTLNPSVCDSFAYGGFDTAISTTGTYYDTLKTVNGCDSIVKINLTVNSASTGAISPTACGSYTVPSGDETYTSDGTYSDTLENRNAQNCDSILTINLTVNDPTTATIDTSVCDSYTVPSGDETYSSGGTYNDTLKNQNAQNCDSIITINLTINQVDTAVNQVGDTLKAQAADATYQWLDCDNGFAPIDGATKQSFKPFSDGNYAVEVSKNNCTDTSSCYQVETTGIAANGEKGAFEVYPNPAADQVTIVQQGNAQPQTFELQTLTGKRLKTGRLSGTERLDVNNLSPGVYLLQVQGADAVRTKKVVIE